MQCCKLPEVVVLELVVQMLRISLLILLELLVEEEEVGLDIPGLVLLALEKLVGLGIPLE